MNYSFELEMENIKITNDSDSDSCIILEFKAQHLVALLDKEGIDTLIKMLNLAKVMVFQTE